MTSRAVDTEFGIAIFGLNDVKRALRDVAPDLRKEMDKEIRSLVKPVADRAKSNVPSMPVSRWNDIPAAPGSRASRSPYKRWEYDRLRWDASEVRRGISVRQGGRRRRGQAVSAAWRIQNRSAAGAVYEVAGRKSQGEVFNRNLPGQPGRLIWDAWDSMGVAGRLPREIAQTVDKYERLLQQRIDRADDRSV